MSAEAYREFLRSGGSELAPGSDSTVYKAYNEQFVIKIYDQHLSQGKELDLEKAILYMHVTNRVSASMEIKGYYCDFFGSQVRVYTNPILDIIFDEREDCCVNVSPFIGGPRLMDLHKAFWDGVDAFKKVPEIADFEWVDTAVITQRLNLPFAEQIGLQELETMIKEEFGVTGTGLGEANIKMVKEGLVITDLCNYVDRLEVSDPGRFRNQNISPVLGIQRLGQSIKRILCKDSS